MLKVTTNDIKTNQPNSVRPSDGPGFLNPPPTKQNKLDEHLVSIQEQESNLSKTFNKKSNDQT